MHLWLIAMRGEWAAWKGSRVTVAIAFTRAGRASFLRFEIMSCTDYASRPTISKGLLCVRLQWNRLRGRPQITLREVSCFHRERLTASYSVEYDESKGCRARPRAPRLVSGQLDCHRKDLSGWTGHKPFEVALMTSPSTFFFSEPIEAGFRWRWGRRVHLAFIPRPTVLSHNSSPVLGSTLMCVDE